MSRLGPALILSALLCAPAGSQAACDASGDHLRWFDGYNYSYYQPGEGTVGIVTGAARVGDAAIAVVGDSNYLQSFRIHPNGELEPANTLGLSAFRIIQVGEYAYVTGSGGLSVVSLDEQAEMALVGTLPLNYGGIDLQGDYVYSATSAGLHVVDVSEPSLPTIIGQSTGAGGLVAAAGERVYIANNVGIWSVDVSDPTDPVYVGLAISDTWTQSIAADGGYLFVSNLVEGLQVFDLSTPDAPVLVNTLPLFGPRSLIHGDGLMLVGGSSSNNYLVDVSVPTAPQLVGEHNGITAEHGVIQDGFAYLACDGAGFQILELNAATNPAPLASFAEWPQGRDFTGFGTHLAYRLSHSVELLDVTDPLAPSFVASLPFSFTTRMVASGSHAYVVDQDGLHVIDFTNPSIPIEIGLLPGIEGSKLSVTGDRIYASTNSNVFTVDISDPSQPTLLGTTPPIFLDPTAIAGSGTDLFLSEEFESSGTLYRLDFTDPNAPQYLEIRSATVITDLLHDGELLYAAGRNGLTIHDPVTLDPLENVGSRSFAGRGMTLGSGGSILTMESTGAFHGFATTSGLEYAYTGSTPAGNGYGVAEVDGRLWVSDFDELHVYDLLCAPSGIDQIAVQPQDLTLRASPNPTSGPTRFAWQRNSGSGSGDVAEGSERVEIFDAAGRLLRSIDVTEGTPFVSWDGLDRTGTAVPSGVVFARVRTERGTASQIVRIVR